MSYFYFVSKSRTQIKIKSNSSKSQTFRSPAEKQKDLGLNGDIKQEWLVTWDFAVYATNVIWGPSLK